MASINNNAPRYPSNFVGGGVPTDVTTTAGHLDDNYNAGRVIRDEVKGNIQSSFTAITASSDASAWTYTPSLTTLGRPLTIAVTQLGNAGNIAITGIVDGASVVETIAVTNTAANYTTSNKFHSITAITLPSPTLGDVINIKFDSTTYVMLALTVAAGPAWRYNGAASLTAVVIPAVGAFNFGLAPHNLWLSISTLGVTTTGAQVVIYGTKKDGTTVSEKFSFTDAESGTLYALVNQYVSIGYVIVLSEAGTALYAGANLNAFTVQATPTSIYPTDNGAGATTIGSTDAPYTSAISELNIALTNLSAALTAFSTAQSDLTTASEKADFAEGRLNRVNWLRENALNMTEEIYKLNGKYDVLGLLVSTAWNNSTTYKVGDRVQVSGVEYVAIQSGSNQNPTSATTYWATQNNIVSAVPAFMALLPTSPYPTDLGRKWPHTSND